MKSYPIIFFDFSIAGIKKQWEWQKFMKQLEQRNESVGLDVYEVTGSMLQAQAMELGCKTETRRLTGLKEINKNPDDWQFAGFEPSNNTYGFSDIKADGHTKWIKCPYGAKGSEIWVREKFAKSTQEGKYIYAADGYEFTHELKSPLFMPREASRITLINEGVTVERLQDITEEGAMREGIAEELLYPCPESKLVGFEHAQNNYFRKAYKKTYKEIYERIWIEMHGEESWSLNPWVFVLKFTVKEIKQ